jgi:nickel transport protein
VFGALILFLVLLPGSAHGHDLWLEKEPGGLTLYYGHKRSAHGGEKFLEYKPDLVKEASCFDRSGTRMTFEAQDGYPYRMMGKCAVAYVLTSSGYWTKTPYGTKNVPRAEARMPIKSWQSYESVKRIDSWDERLAAPLSGGLEMTPREDPLGLKKGEKLRLQVTFDGRPVEGVVVSYDGKPRGESDREGRINIRLRHGGFQVIQAGYHRPDGSGKADEVVHSANLNFELSED